MEIDWKNVQKILVVRLRSIGDTVLSTPSLIALRRFLPDAQIDILLEDWVAPVLDGFEAVDNVLTVSKNTKDRIKLARKLRREKYDLAFNFHGGTTSTFLIRASGAKHRVGYRNYQYSFLYNHLLTSASDFWQKKITHSAEQQLALVGFVRVPVGDKPNSKLCVTNQALESLANKFANDLQFQIPNSKYKTENQDPNAVVQSIKTENSISIGQREMDLGHEKSKVQNPKSKIALLHPVAAFETKQWATNKFAKVAEFLAERDFQIVAVATRKERGVLEKLEKLTDVPIKTFDNLTLPEITALASKAEIFVGNDSGIAHIAAAVGTSSVIIFGSSNRDHWRPWTDAPYEIIYEEMPCQPCAGYICEKFDEPRCILNVEVKSVTDAIAHILTKRNKYKGEK